MPELPEVETVRRGLAPVMEGSTLERLELRRKDLRFPFPQGLAERVSGRRIVALSRRSKYLLIELDSDDIVIAHLGMSGSFRTLTGQEALTPGDFHHERSKDGKHDHVLFHLKTSGGAAQVIYNDPRRFGFMDLARRADLSSNTYLKDLGPEPTGNWLDENHLAERFFNKAQPLKSALLDQKNIAGLGNIYVCEALFRARLSPMASASTLVTKTGRPTKALTLLTQTIRETIAEAIEAGGSSLRDHIQTDGSLGYFQHRFQIYDREGEACVAPGCSSTVLRLVQAGRSTFYCPSCQR